MIEKSMDAINFPLLLTFFAGMSTVLGGCFVFLCKRINGSFLSFGLGFSAGVMIYLAFFELLKEANTELESALGYDAGWQVIAFFLVGMAITAIIDLVTAHQTEVCSNAGGENSKGKKRRRSACLFHTEAKKRKLLKTGVFVAFAIALHNFPEGMITFTATTLSYTFGIPVAIAVAIHNIPEGFCIALPIYYATGSKLKGVLYAFLAGLAEPIGALAVYFFLSAYLNSLAIGVMLSIVAGIMVYISFDELLPTANRFSSWHTGLFGLIFGMIMMAMSLYLLN